MSYMERNQKKEKPSKYNFHDYGHISSAPAVHIQLQEGSILTSKIAKHRQGIKSETNYVLQNNSTGPTKVFVASLDCLTNGWISLNHRHSIESNGCCSKIHCHSIYTFDRLPTIHSNSIHHSLTMVL